VPSTEIVGSHRRRRNWQYCSDHPFWSSIVLAKSHLSDLLIANVFEQCQHVRGIQQPLPRLRVILLRLLSSSQIPPQLQPFLSNLGCRLLQPPWNIRGFVSLGSWSSSGMSVSQTFSALQRRHTALKRVLRSYLFIVSRLSGPSSQRDMSCGHECYKLFEMHHYSAGQVEETISNQKNIE